MPTFIIMGNLTEKAVEKIREEGERQKNAYDLAKQLGAEVKALYYTMGKYDWIGIVEAPDNETALKGLFMLGAGGFTRTRTMLAFPADDVAKMTADLPKE
ncbi:MAG: GYD domain-containing protein [Candidatus Thorarchaeota archaeon]|nr:MAG: GYD domain-containing protein [Candidatus Thorarchaeota archaeon]